MNAPNRVEELRKRYHENPKRYFAPLANEYRKTGFVDRAILLCEKHLAEQPGNMNGLVVYGQCLFESGRVAEAAAPFEEALGVDPENLIALRHLGDIARLGGDAPAARGWYERVLELDRRNEEVLELIEQVGGREVREPNSGPSAARNIISVAPSVRVAGADDAFHMGNIELGGGAAAPEDPPAQPPAPATRAAASAASSAAPASASSAPTAVRASARALPPDSTAKTLEIPDPSRAGSPKRRASLLDIAFDFGEGALADLGVGDPTPPPATPAPPATPEAPAAPTRTPEPERPRTSIATPKPGRVVGVLADYIAEKSDRISTGELLETVPPPAPPDVPVGSLIDTPVAPISLDDLPSVPGLLATDFSRDVNPLPDLEATEFQSGLVAGIEGLESMEFSVDAESLMSAAEPSSFEGGLLETPEEVGGLPPLAEEEPRPDDDDAFESVSLGELPMDDDHGLGPVQDVDVELPADDDGETVHGALTETPRTFVTETMAQLYLEQGFRERAIGVYRQLIDQDPDDAGLRERLAALEATDPPSLGFELPEEVEEEEDAPPPNAMLAGVSFADVALQTPPEPSRAPTPRAPTPRSPTPAAVPAASPPASPGPTAREFLRAFARRALTPAASSAIGREVSVDQGAGASQRSMGSALDALFGGNVSAEDERAAHRLAGVGATSGPSGGSAMDSLFGEGPSAPAPRATPRASDRIRFDRFFTPAEPAPAAPAPEESSSAPSTDPSSAADEGGPDDDLDQFQGWLRGLTP